MEFSNLNQIPAGYPTELSDKDLHEVIQACSRYAKAPPYLTRFEHWYSLIQIGQAEIQFRNQKRFGKSSKRLNYVTIGLALATILLAGITVWHANRDLKSDEDWQNQQTELLWEQVLIQEQIVNNQAEATIELERVLKALD